MIDAVILGLIVCIAVYYVFLLKPGECYECGKRFGKNDIRYKSKCNKHLCKACYGKAY